MTFVNVVNLVNEVVELSNHMRVMVDLMKNQDITIQRLEQLLEQLLEQTTRTTKGGEDADDGDEKLEEKVDCNGNPQGFAGNEGFSTVWKTEGWSKHKRDHTSSEATVDGYKDGRPPCNVCGACADEDEEKA